MERQTNIKLRSDSNQKNNYRDQEVYLNQNQLVKSISNQITETVNFDQSQLDQISRHPHLINKSRSSDWARLKSALII